VANQPHMEKMIDCGNVLSVEEFMERAILIVLANKRYVECFI